MNLKECYEAMHGDYDDVMGRLPREASIIKYLRRFAENEEFAELLTAAGNKDYRRVFELSHDLKGMAANLSITGFQKKVSAVCEETRDREPGEGFAALVKEAEEEYQVVLAAVKELEDAQ